MKSKVKCPFLEFTGQRWCMHKDKTPNKTHRKKPCGYQDCKKCKLYRKYIEKLRKYNREGYMA